MPLTNIPKRIETIHNSAIKHKDLKKYKAEINALAKEIQQEKDGFTFLQALELVRREHIIFLSARFPKAGIRKTFSLEEPVKSNTIIELIDQDTYYTSEQIPVGELRNCYHRWKAGIPAFRKHLFKKANNDTLIEYYHHSSPVPYEIKDFEERINATVQNLNEVWEKTGQHPLTEIRLLSTNRWFLEQEHQQVLETAFALFRSNKPITLLVYGVNAARFFNSDYLQDWINIRALNELFEKAIAQLNLSLPKELTNVREKRQTLTEAIQKISLKNQKHAEKEFTQLLENHHAHEQALYEHFIGILDRTETKLHQQSMINDLAHIATLASNKIWTAPAYNYHIQALLVRLSRRLGHAVATGCNDAKDRDGRLTITIEAHEIFHDLYQRHANLGNEEDLCELQTIEKTIFALSSANDVAAAVSMPDGFSQGLGLQGFIDGNDHLVNPKKHPHVFKDILYPEIYSARKSDFSNIFKALGGKSDTPPTPPETLQIGKDKPVFTKPEKIIPIEEDHQIEVYSDKIFYKTDELPHQTLLEKIVKTMIDEAFEKFTPTCLEDLQLKGNATMQEIARKYVNQKLARLNQPITLQVLREDLPRPVSCEA